MQRIELVGPPGVGKSTLKNLMISRSMKIPILDQRYCILKEKFSSNMVRLLQNVSFKNNNLLHSIAKMVIVPSKHRIMNRQSHKMANMSDEYKRFMPYYINNLTNSPDKPENIHKRLWLFMESFSHAEFCDAAAGKDIVVFDEGLAQRCVGLALTGISIEKLERTFFLCPLPFMLIKVKADKAQIIKRLQFRDGNKSDFIEMVELAEKASVLCAEIFKSRGCRIMEVTTNDDLLYKPEIIGEFIMR